MANGQNRLGLLRCINSARAPSMTSLLTRSAGGWWKARSCLLCEDWTTKPPLPNPRARRHILGTVAPRIQRGLLESSGGSVQAGSGDHSGSEAASHSCRLAVHVCKAAASRCAHLCAWEGAMCHLSEEAHGSSFSKGKAQTVHSTAPIDSIYPEG
jgi:hypothetical protein